MFQYHMQNSMRNILKEKLEYVSKANQLQVSVNGHNIIIMNIHYGHTKYCNVIDIHVYMYSHYAHPAFY